MASPQPTTVVVEKAAPKPAVVEQVSAANPPTTPVVQNNVQTTEPHYVEHVERRTTHKRWLLPLWLLQLGLFLCMLIDGARFLHLTQGIRTARTEDSQILETRDLVDDTIHSVRVGISVLVAMASLSIATVLIEIFLWAAHSLHPGYHLFSSAFRTAIWLAVLIWALAENTHFYTNSVNGQDYVYINGGHIWLPVLFL